MVWPVIALAVLLGVAFFEIAFHLFFGHKALAYFESCPPAQVPSKPADPGAERIEFPNGAGQTLRGAILKSSGQTTRGLVVFCPEMKANFWSFQAYLPAARLAGFDILAFDFRNQGESDSEAGYSPLHWLTRKEISDLQAAVDFARARPEYKDLPIVLHGVSRGAGAALAVAAERSDISGVVTQGAFSCWSLLDYYMRKWKSSVVPRLQYVLPDWHNRITMAVTKRLSERRRGAHFTSIEPLLPRLAATPLLWMAAQRDSCVPTEVADSLFAKTGRPDSDFWAVPKARHNGERVAQLTEFDRRLVRFLCMTAGIPVLPGDVKSVDDSTPAPLAVRYDSRHRTGSKAPTGRRFSLETSKDGRPEE